MIRRAVTEKPRETAIACARIADSKKAQDIVVLNVSKVFFISDYFVICSCDSAIQAQSIAAEIEKEMEERGNTLYGREGYEDRKWILLDYGSIVVHIFRKEARTFYDIDNLWGDGRPIKWYRTPRKRK